MHQEPYHIEADKDHTPVPDFDYYECKRCGYAVTADGKHHGFEDE